MVVVDGEGTAEGAPDQFVIVASLRSEVGDQRKALEQIAKKLSELEETFPKLAGMTAFAVYTTSASVAPAYQPSCAEQARYGNADNCPTIGSIGKATLRITASPSEAAGPAVAILAELGMTEVSFQGFSLSDEARLKSAADAIAITDAENRAKRLAEAAGANLGPLLRVQFGDGLAEPAYYDPYRARSTARGVFAAQDVLAPKISPEIELKLSPEPIEHKSKVTVAYALEDRGE